MGVFPAPSRARSPPGAGGMSQMRWSASAAGTDRVAFRAFRSFGWRAPACAFSPPPPALGAPPGAGRDNEFPGNLVAIPLVFVSLILQGRENSQQRLRFALRHQVGRQPSVFVAPVHPVEDQHETHHENYREPRKDF